MSDDVVDIATRRRLNAVPPPSLDDVQAAESDVVVAAVRFFRWFEEHPTPFDLPAAGVVLLDACERLCEMYDHRKSSHPSRS